MSDLCNDSLAEEQTPGLQAARSSKMSTDTGRLRHARFSYCNKISSVVLQPTAATLTSEGSFGTCTLAGLLQPASCRYTVAIMLSSAYQKQDLSCSLGYGQGLRGELLDEQL
jgi:hypothetical protein